MAERRRAGEPVGAGNYVVRDGDCLLSISERTGHFWQTLWEHVANMDLRLIREDPAVLYPGDQLFVPELRTREENAPTDQRHRYVRKGVPAKMRIQFLRDGQPKANVSYKLEIDGTLGEGSTDSTGTVEVFIPPGAAHGSITVGEGDDTEFFELELGRLDPIDTVAGAQARLHNLGFSPGRTTGSMNPDTVRAVLEYQKANGLDETGELDDATRRSLLQMHGS
jgi:hypothetical protein